MLGESVAVARVRGEIDMSTVRALAEGVLPVAETGPAGLIVDLSAVSFMGAAGLHLLEQVQTALRRRGGSLAVVAPGGIPRRVLEVTRLEEALGVVATVEAAHAVLGGER